MAVVRLSEMVHDQEGDFFALLTSKEELTTRDGKPYCRVGFRDAQREVAFPIWDNSPWAADCRSCWTPGEFYKLRAAYRETSYGPQLEIRRIRPVCPGDGKDGFDPTMCLPRSRFDPQEMYAELSAIIEEQIEDGPLRRLVQKMLADHREQLLAYPAACRHHHAFCGGLLEHVLSMVHTCCFLAEKYAKKYDDMRPPLDKGLVVAGAVLHDIGKLLELDPRPGETVFSPAGALLGHLLLGRDMVRQAAAEVGLEGETLLRLEHLIIAHQRLPEWGSPKPPMTPEALIVHYADDLDAKFDMMARALAEDRHDGPLTSDKNLLRYRVFRGTSP